MLRALHSVSREGDVNCDLARAEILGCRHGDAVNDLVGKVEQCQLDVVDKVRDIVLVENDGDSSESFVQASCEGKSKSLGVEVVEHIISLEAQLLHLILRGDKEVVSDVQDIISVGAHSLRAVDIAVGGIADTAADLAVVPVLVFEGDILLEVRNNIVVPAGGVCHILDILARSVAGAVIGAGSSLASLALITVKACALTSATVANTSAGTLCILVESTTSVRGINPSQFKRANSIGTISAFVRETNPPVVVALADLIGQTGTVTTAVIVTVCADRSSKGQKYSG